MKSAIIVVAWALFSWHHVAADFFFGEASTINIGLAKHSRLGGILTGGIGSRALWRWIVRGNSGDDLHHDVWDTLRYRAVRKGHILEFAGGSDGSQSSDPI